jgi:signal transduction histidine kinase
VSEVAAPAEAGGWRRHLPRQLLQAAVWGSYGALSVWLFTRSAGLYSGLVMIALVLAVGLWVAAELVRSLFRRRGWLRLPPASLALRLLAAVAILAAVIQLLIFALLHLGLATRLLEMPGGVSGYTSVMAFVYWFNTGVLLLLWGTVWVGYAALRQSRQDVLARLRAEAEHRRLELESLRARLNPHFVFNALNNVRALINEDPDRARELVTRLSNTLRHALQHSQRERVTLAEEWAVMQDYLAVEAVQFERRLQVEAELDPALAGFVLPPMLLQLLVENAIKHGIACTPGGGLLRVEARRDAQGGLQLRVENPGRLQDMPGAGVGTGVGLAWLRAQIEGLGLSAHFRLWTPLPGWVRAELVLPA